METELVHINGHNIVFPVLDGSIENSPVDYDSYDSDTQRKIIRHLIDHAKGEEDDSFLISISSDRPIDIGSLNNMPISIKTFNYIRSWNERCTLEDDEDDSLMLYKEGNVYHLYNTYEDSMVVEGYEVNTIISMMHSTEKVYGSYGFLLGDTESRI